MYEIYFTRSSQKELSKLPTLHAKQVTLHISKLSFPFPKNYDVKMMKAKGFYRLRVGKIRILFEVDQKCHEIWIRKIGYRGGVYK